MWNECDGTTYGCRKFLDSFFIRHLVGAHFTWLQVNSSCMWSVHIKRSEVLSVHSHDLICAYNRREWKLQMWFVCVHKVCVCVCVWVNFDWTHTCDTIKHRVLFSPFLSFILPFPYSICLACLLVVSQCLLPFRSWFLARFFLFCWLRLQFAICAPTERTIHWHDTSDRFFVIS